MTPFPFRISNGATTSPGKLGVKDFAALRVAVEPVHKGEKIHDSDSKEADASEKHFQADRP